MQELRQDDAALDGRLPHEVISSGFEGCLNQFIPLEADVALIGFADVCTPPTALPIYNGTFGFAMESIIRELAARPDPPAIVLFNYYKFVSWSCTLAVSGAYETALATKRHEK